MWRPEPAWLGPMRVQSRPEGCTQGCSRLDSVVRIGAGDSAVGRCTRLSPVDGPSGQKKEMPGWGTCAPSTLPEGGSVPSIGSHCILELHDCPAAVLDDIDAIRNAIREAARRANSTLLQEVAHRFEPQGVTALGLLAESHISIHTWPELGYAAADVFTCGEEAEPERACKYLAEAMEAERFELRRLPRGIEAPLPAPRRDPIDVSAPEVA